MAAAATSVASKLQALVDAHDLVIFSALVGPGQDKTCPYVAKTIKALDSAGITFHHHIAGKKGTAERTALIALCHGVKTVPQGFCLGKYIGGFDASDAGHLGFPGITPLLQSGKLEKALKSKDASLLS